MHGNSKILLDQPQSAVVWGFGHVGKITAWYLLSKTDMNITVVEKDPELIVNWLRSPNSAKKLIEENKLREAISLKRLRFISFSEYNAAFDEISLHFVCVNTPTHPDGTQDLRSVIEVLKLLKHIKTKNPITIRSTTLPGMTSSLAETYYKSTGTQGSLISLPCFVRSFEYVNDLAEPDRIVIGSISRSIAIQLARSIALDEQRICYVSLEEAELAKYADNVFHALKITYANEIAALAKQYHARPEVILDIVQSGRLSSNEYYLAAGMPYGGGCLPKDIDALLSQMHQELPVLQAIQRSNQLQSRAGRAAHFSTQVCGPWVGAQTVQNHAEQHGADGGRQQGIAGLQFGIHDDHAKHDGGQPARTEPADEQAGFVVQPRA